MVDKSKISFSLMPHRFPLLHLFFKNLPDCYDLNVCLPNSHGEILIPNLMVLAVVVFERCIGHESKALKTGISALMEDGPLLLCEDTARGTNYGTGRGPSPELDLAGALIPAFGTMRNKFLLFIRPPVCAFLL